MRILIVALSLLLITLMIVLVVGYAEYSELNAKYDHLRREYSKLNESFNAFLINYSKTQKRYKCMLSKYNELMDKYSALEEYFSKVKLNIERISKRIVIPEESFPELLNQSLGGEVSELVKEELLLKKSMPPETKAKTIMEWVMINMQYFQDDYHHYLVDGRRCVGRDYLSLPNETLARGGGDCEDLAILVYAMLRSVLGESEKVYLIGIMERYYYRDGWGRAHVAVLYETKKGFMILDPAMSYVSNGKIVVSFVVEKNGTLYEIKLRIIDLSPSHKEYLLENGLAELAYIDPLDPSTPAKHIYQFLDIRSSINLWLSYTSSAIPLADVWLLANGSFVETFDSTETFLKWVEAGKA